MQRLCIPFFKCTKYKPRRTNVLWLKYLHLKALFEDEQLLKFTPNNDNNIHIAVIKMAVVVLALESGARRAMTLPKFSGIFQSHPSVAIVLQIRVWCEYSQTARFTGPTWGPPGSCRSQMGPMFAPINLSIRAVSNKIRNPVCPVMS